MARNANSSHRLLNTLFKEVSNVALISHCSWTVLFKRFSLLILTSHLSLNNNHFLHYFSAPSIVASFKVLSISATDVTVFWEPEPLSKQKGVILYYQIGLVQKNGNQQQYTVIQLYQFLRVLCKYCVIAVDQIYLS